MGQSLRRYGPRQLYQSLKELVPGVRIVPDPLQYRPRHPLDHLEELLVIGFHAASVSRLACRDAANIWRVCLETKPRRSAGVEVRWIIALGYSVLRLRLSPRPASPKPSSASVPGSGTGALTLYVANG